MKALVLGLLMWINQHTHLQYDLPTVPAVEPRHPTHLVASMFKGGIPAGLNLADLRNLETGLVAIYNYDRKTIYVKEGIDLSSVYGKSVLVHELVHFIQYEHGEDRHVRCVNALERDAYEIQAEYLRAHGAVPNFDPFTVALRSGCAIDG